MQQSLLLRQGTATIVVQQDLLSWVCSSALLVAFSRQHKHDIDTQLYETAQVKSVWEALA
ncbi:hypothetical protein P608_17610 [Comamonas thiooxydans]|uniref:Uncharacterized protein n=1 Tax=Comamonas thiooxydans TaxID=363952 RepID=A0A0E3BV32_9BURK|nr:hypothetical protein P608_17610 [Comamonas thiooxydans]KGH16338.1 hypothetical protein P607_20415 [Comamonas thiooxydans]KGH20513.1 hypothetical protein P606_21120 [Comamonas thiooxydans]KKI12123.1 hypothetical protein XA67_21420 [Comamonas thiooxydans]